ncbi:TetR/AcrR family transcriptional regulator (plasmid) [Sphingomonas paeninsulae]|jgi:AcrR family transcriptional regulator|uniref:TetR/AcrR family transcriptional regulator n=1 Tax=Sphingomonas paeninsulae TaxID=2319844 RepID=A0A494TIL7_SPHPE|nr:TetR/AcrR family transcriptional regulator [Sphingomonas paeninsulae]AYJ85268.1 TetR/AcrR family transcriptional regulator [Sphingomonas paeninsulae]
MAVLLTETQIHEARDKIVRVAERQAVELGMERVSMHSIARALGWSATALYRYFENKDAILAAARTAAFDRLSDRLEAAMEGPGDIWSRSREVGNAYVDFAFQNPEAYRLIFELSQAEFGQYPELDTANARGRANMIRYVETMVAEGALDTDPELLAYTFWAALHGIISLQMAGKLTRDAPSFETIRRDMVRRIVHSALGPAARRERRA